jgi:diguanylate cyclase (GGDEF)-like protein/PAS domain S-box-containing protein
MVREARRRITNRNLPVSMDKSYPTSAPTVSANPVSRDADARLEAVSNLIDQLEAQVDDAQIAESAFENKLVQVRLGLGSSLFSALRAKHAPTAAHSLRVAMGCSSWASLLQLPDQMRDEIELAALLHDIGKIGVPDRILLKPGKLTRDEFLVVENHRRIGVEILRSCAASPPMLNIVHYAGAWFDGSREGYDLRSEQLPLGARILAIVDAFDAMTSDQVYRRALSRERAVAELFEFAGVQFDPQLVREFCSYLSADLVRLHGSSARRWLKHLQPEHVNTFWQLSQATGGGGSSADHVFQQRLLENMHDAVIFVDSSLRIVLWNRAAERLTGISAASIEHKHWSPSLVSLRDDRHKLVDEDDCPVIQAIRQSGQTLKRLSITGRNQQVVEVDAHVVPVHGKNGVTFGAAVLLHDASSQITLEQRIQCLHERATRDPLTQVANRAEFDRFFSMTVSDHLKRQLPCSLIICDIDHFKKVNDTFGHQAGDEVLVNFAALLRRNCRAGDLVARYGGEEFVMLCSDCDNSSATRKADEIRAELAELPLPALNGRCVTASFGVTELQSGDTPETMLRRADRGLYQAKENGRNCVVQLGSGFTGEDPAPRAKSWFNWFRREPADQLLERTLATAVPLNVVVEKMRGFVSDYYAEVERIEEGHLLLRINGQNSPLMRRSTDRPVAFLIEMWFEEGKLNLGSRTGIADRTIVRVSVRPVRSRDRRQSDVMERARKMLANLKSYLVAQEIDRKHVLPANTPVTPVDETADE